MTEPNAAINDKREIFGWAMYDWANSAFSTTIGAAFLGKYIYELAKQAAAQYPDGIARLFGVPIAPASAWAFTTALSVVFQAGLLPIFGAIADYSHRRKQMLQIFATIGGLTTVAMFFVSGTNWWLGSLLYIIANIAFGAAIVFYNAYLPDIASEDERDRVSSYGWAMGYLGGGILLAVNLALFIFAENLGISSTLAVRINLASAGLWWLGFSSVTWKRLRSRHTAKSLPAGENILSVAFRQLSETMGAPARLIAILLLSPLLIVIWAPLIAPTVLRFLTVQHLPEDLAILPIFLPVLGPLAMLVIFLRKKARELPETSKFLTSYLVYNDGIQTVIPMAATFAGAALVEGGLELPDDITYSAILMIQFVAFGGALLWGRLAKRIGSKEAIITSLVIWAAAVTYAYFGMKGENRIIEFLALAAVIAIVLGGSQAISRSVFAQMIPKSKEAEYFSIYEISERGSSWLGPVLFGIANQVFGSLRYGILSLIFFFLVGLILLPFVNVRKAIADVRAFDEASS